MQTSCVRKYKYDASILEFWVETRTTGEISVTETDMMTDERTGEGTADSLKPAKLMDTSSWDFVADDKNMLVDQVGGANVF